MKLFQICFLALVLAAFAGCDTMSEMVTSHVPDSHTGRASLLVSLRAQKVYLYRGDYLVATARISSGREGHRSPVGRFRITRKDIDHRSSLYGAYVDDSNRLIKADVDTRRDPKPRHGHFVGAPMPYFMEFAPGYGLHQGYLPGEPASHGCIRMPYWKVREFFDAVHVGTPITVKR